MGDKAELAGDVVVVVGGGPAPGNDRAVARLAVAGVVR
jgi:hypothetical protein